LASLYLKESTSAVARAKIAAASVILPFTLLVALDMLRP